MIGANGEIINLPFCNIPLHKWPWDVRALINLKQYIDMVNREVMLKEQFPSPTERTKMSEIGFEEWKIWVKAKEDEKMRRGVPNENESPKDKWEIFTPGMKMVWDYKIPSYLCFQEPNGRIWHIEDMNIAGGKRRG